MNHNEEKSLRESIRYMIRSVKQKKQSEETKLRAIVRGSIINEIKLMEKTGIGSIEPPSDSTGLNKLDTVLSTIVPRIEQFYKELTTDVAQRKSFRAHFLRSIMKELLPIDLNQDAAEAASADNEGRLDEEVDIKFSIPDDESEPDMSKFRAIDGMDKNTEEENEENEEEPEEAKYSRELGLEDEEETGRDFAMDAWKATKGIIIPVYAKLHNDEDSKLFYDYLITNMKVWFNIFDDQLAKSVKEPEGEKDYDTPEGADAIDSEDPAELDPDLEPDSEIPDLSFAN